MKKLLLALPLVAGASWAGTSYYAGVQSESAYDQLLTQMDIMDPLVFEKESYSKGLTTSHAVTLVKESAAADASVIFRLQHEINHSPITIGDDGTEIGSATIRTTLADDQSNADIQKLREKFNGEPIELVTKVNGLGSVETTVTVEGSKFEYDEGKFVVEKSVFDLTTADSRTQGNGLLGAITFSFDEGDVEFEPSQVDLDITHNSATSYDWDFSMLTDVVTMTSDSLPVPMKMFSTKIGSDSVLENGKIDQNFTFAVGGLDLGDLMPKDQLPVSSFSITGGFSDIDLASFEAYTKKANQMTIEDQLEMAMSDDISSTDLEMIRMLVTRGTALTYNVKLGNDGGDASADYVVRFIGDDSTNGFEDIVTVSDALNAVEMDLNVKVDKAALEMTPAAMFTGSPEMAMALVDAGDHYYSTATLRGTAVELNGNFFPLQDMVGDMLDMPIEAMIEMGGM